MDKGKHRPLQKKEAALSVQERDDETEIKEEGISGERSLMKRMQKGDETAFIQLVEQYHTSLLRLARRYVSTQSSAEEVVQETWMGVHQRLPFFEGRSSLKTWIVRILINRAHTCALRDRRMIPFSALTKREEEPDVFAVEPEHFQGDGQPFSGGWTSR